MNDSSFDCPPNLKFVAGNLWENIDEIENPETMLIHCRTGTLIPFDDLCDLYGKFARKGIRSIGIAEHFRFDAEAGLFRDQNDEAFTSVTKTRTGQTYLHNYKKALQDAGYHIISDAMTPDVSYRGVNPLTLGEYIYVAIAELN